MPRRPLPEKAEVVSCIAPSEAYYLRTVAWEVVDNHRRTEKSGRSSGVERNLAKVEVVSSNLIARSILFNNLARHSITTGPLLSQLCHRDVQFLWII